MNREQIIKASEFCGVGCELRHCTSECPYFAIPLEDTEDCCDVLARDALALIKEFVEENEKLNERLNREAKRQYDLATKIVNLRDDVKYIKAETVQKMKERLKAKAEIVSTYGNPTMVDVDYINQIAKELLEENNV